MNVAVTVSSQGIIYPALDGDRQRPSGQFEQIRPLPEIHRVLSDADVRLDPSAYVLDVSIVEMPATGFSSQSPY